MSAPTFALSGIAPFSARKSTPTGGLRGTPAVAPTWSKGHLRGGRRARPVAVRAKVSTTPKTLEDPAAYKKFQTLKRAYPLEYKEEQGEVKLEVEGTLPSWLDSTCFRNGPGRYDAGTRVLSHMFGGYSLLCKLYLDGSANRATLRTRFLRSDAYKAVAERGGQKYLEFGSPLHEGEGPVVASKNLIGNALSGITDNAGVTVVPMGDGQRMLALSETPNAAYEFDPRDLSTGEKWKWQADGFTGLLQCAHAMPDGQGGIWNVHTHIGPGQGYQVVRTPAGNPKSKQVVANIPSALPTPGWVHAFAMTPSYIVILEHPAYYNLNSFLGVGKGQFSLFDWAPEKGSKIMIVEKATGDVTVKEAPPFFFFHLGGAYEETGSAGQVESLAIDVCAYDDPRIVEHLDLPNICAEPGTPGYSDIPESRLMRLRAPLGWSKSREVTMEEVSDPAVTGGFADFGVVNPNVKYQKHRYVFALSKQGFSPAGNAVAKIDTLGSAGRSWSEVEEGVLPGEPAFIPRPGAEEEDDGVVVAWCNAPDRSFMAVLDGKTMEVLAKVHAPEGRPWPAGFHGWVLPGRV